MVKAKVTMTSAAKKSRDVTKKIVSMVTSAAAVGKTQKCQ